MNAPADGDLPRARVRKSRWPAAIWLLPIGATVVVGWLLVRELFLSGIELTVRFPSAQGITAAGTPVMHKGVRIGSVTGVALSEDLGHVLVHLSIDDLDAFAREGARYWIAAPRLDLQQPSDLLSGATIHALPGSGAPVERFDGLSEAPIEPPDEAGTCFELLLDESARFEGAIAPDAAVLHRGKRVGRVLGTRSRALDPTTVVLFVAAPFDRAVGPRTVFWRTSGVSTRASVEDIRFEIASLQTLISGGVQFGDTEEGVPARRPGTPLRLYIDYEAARDALRGPQATFGARFLADDGVPARDAPVTLAGELVGRVRARDLRLGSEDGELHVDVVFALDADRLARLETPGEAHDDLRARIDGLVARGLRARMQRTPIIVGELEVALVVRPGAPPAALDRSVDPPRIPAVGEPQDVGSLLAAATDIVQSVDPASVDAIVRDVRQTVGALRAIVTGPEVQRSVHRLDTTTKALAEAAQAAAGAAAALQELSGSDVRPETDIPELVDRMAQAAEALRHLAATLARKPEAVLWGR